MTRVVEYRYQILEGRAEHGWKTSEPPSPVHRYWVVRTVLVNGEVVDEPLEHEKKMLMPEVYSEIQLASDKAWELNKAWFDLDPNKDFYASIQ